MSKGSATSCKEAIARWVAADPENNKIAESEKVKLICQIPSLKKMDNKLNDLTACTHLSLSTNVIERIQPLDQLKNLRILSLGRNGIKKIEKLDGVKDSLEELWLSYNSIEKLDGLGNLTNLKCIYLSNNSIKNFDELLKLVDLTKGNLAELLLVGNPMYAEAMDKATANQKKFSVPDQPARYEVLKRLPKLKKLDGAIVTDAEVEAAQAYSADA